MSRDMLEIEAEALCTIADKAADYIKGIFKDYIVEKDPIEKELRLVSFRLRKLIEERRVSASDDNLEQFRRTVVDAKVNG